MNRIKSHFCFSVFFSIALGAFLRLYKIGSKSLWLDEACSVYLAKLPLFDMLSQIIKTDIHPPLYNLLLHFWIVPSTSEWYVHLLSALFSIITVWIVFLIGKNLFSAKVGIIACFITSISSYQIYYAQEARLYALITLLCTLSFLIFINALRTHNAKIWILLCLINILALYTYVYSVFFIIAEYLAAICFSKSIRVRTRIVLLY